MALLCVTAQANSTFHTEQVVDERRFAHGVLPDEKHEWFCLDVLIRQGWCEEVFVVVMLLHAIIQSTELQLVHTRMHDKVLVVVILLHAIVTAADSTHEKV